MTILADRYLVDYMPKLNIVHEDTQPIDHDEEIFYMSASQVIALLDETLEGNEKDFGIDDDGMLFLQWNLTDQRQLNNATRICEIRGLRLAVQPGGVRIYVSGQMKLMSDLWAVE